ncbi:MAG: CsbD family protein [Solirubrobacteraceae bacterium]
MTNKNIDKAKGRVKEAAGALTGDRHLKNEGRVDQAKGSPKESRRQGRRHPHRPQP